LRRGGLGAAALATCVACAIGAGAGVASARQGALPTGRAIAFTNGHWFNGTGFDDRTVFSVDGKLAFRRPARIDSTVDLKSGYIVPPFADAHNHNVSFDGAARTTALIAKYIREGVFYDQNPLTLARNRAGLNGLVNIPGGIDATFAVGGLTGSGGHPTGLFLRNLKAGVFSAEDGEGGMFWYVDSLPDLDRKWPAILARKSDFLKVFLLHSDEYQKRRDDSAYFNWRGLNPRLVPEIVRRAHAAGLRVMAHVETSADFHNALVGGVDEIGHIPGFRGDETGRLSHAERYIIADSDAALAAKQSTIVVTTLETVADSYSPTGPDSALRRQFDAQNVRNLETLKRYGVRLAIGSDNYRATSVPEALYLSKLGVFSNAELLRVWAEATPRAIFPGRKIGRLQPGYEASFLSLAGNPLADFSNVTRIEMRVKQGKILQPAP
jgi:imidazolonepropionase-like amidohydrolase